MLAGIETGEVEDADDGDAAIGTDIGDIEAIGADGAENS